MAFDIDAIFTGQGNITLGGGTFYSRGNIDVNFVKERNSIRVDKFGERRRNVVDKYISVTFEPAGEFEHLGVLHPFAGMKPGQRLRGGAEAPCVINLDYGTGKRITLLNAVVYKPPGFRLVAGETVLAGQCEIRGLLKQSDPDTSDPAAYFTLADATYAADTAFSDALLKSGGVVADWGATHTAFYGKEGFQVDVNPTLTPLKWDKFGTVDYILEGIEVTARGIPDIGPDAFLTAFDFGEAVGDSDGLAADDLNFVEAGQSVYVTLYNAQLDTGSIRASLMDPAVGELVWKVTRSLTTGVLDAAYYVGTSAP